MARYFFNLIDGSDLPDDEGVELPDVAAARRAAAEFLGAVICDAGAGLFGQDDLSLNVTDERGLILFTVHICCCEATATRAREAERRSAA